MEQLWDTTFTKSRCKEFLHSILTCINVCMPMRRIENLDHYKKTKSLASESSGPYIAYFKYLCFISQLRQFMLALIM